MIEGLFQPTHLIFIVIIALIVLGPAKLGDVGGALGRSVREFRDNVDDPNKAPEQLVTSSSTAALRAPGDDVAARTHADAIDPNDV